MSGFFAVIKTDGSAPDIAQVRSLTAELRYRGPDGSGTWADAHVGMGHALLHTTRSSERETQPLVSGPDQLTVVADARIDDRGRLADELRRAGVPVPGDATDPELILAAYRAWGVDAPAHLLGDFAFALWDGNRQRLLLARDGFGMRCLYLAACPGGWVVSNEIRPLLLYPGVSQAHDRHAMADFLVFGDIQVYDPGQTAFEAVRALPIGGRTLITVDGGREDSIHWRPQSTQPVLRYRRAGEYEEHFREVMREAVRDRIQGRKVLCLLSGGLDSTAAACFAAELTHAGEGADELLALTAVGGADDEEGRLAGVAARHLRIPHRLVDVSACWNRPLATWHSAPYPDSSIFPRTEAQRAAHALAPIQLNGYSADHVLCPEPTTLMHSIRQVGVAQALRAHALLYRRYRKRPALGLRAWWAGRPPPVPGWAGASFEVPDWLDPDFRRVMRLDERCAELAAPVVDFDQGARPLGIHQLRRMWGLRMQEELWPTDHAPGDMPDPFLDQRVLAFLWRLPAAPWFHRKHLLRSAMRGRLPEVILDRPKTPAGARIPAGTVVDIPDDLWECVPEVSSMLRPAGHEAWRGKDPISGLYPALLALWCRYTEPAIRSGHREFDALNRLDTSIHRG